MKRATRDEHLFAPGCKRILSLDGGGLRGILTLSYLRKLEAILRERHAGDPDFRLSDYFDLIGGTSTGAIIASLLATGRSVAEIGSLYRELGQMVFRKTPWRMGVFSPKFESGPLKTALANQLGNITLGSPEIRTGLVLISKRLDTGSLWPIHNNPRGRYFDAPDDDPTAKPNKDLLLRDVVRASCAAPHYFEPEPIEIGNSVTGAFIDGGVSPFNNPALLLLMLVSLEGYRFRWPLGEDDLLLVSFGTGYQEARYTAEDVLKMSPALVAARSLGSIVQDCNVLAQTMLQWVGRCAVSNTIGTGNSATGDLVFDSIGGQKGFVFGSGSPRFAIMTMVGSTHNVGIGISPSAGIKLHVNGAIFATGVMNYMFAEHFDQEPGRVASMVLFGNALAILTIPLALTYALPRFT